MSNGFLVATNTGIKIYDSEYSAMASTTTSPAPNQNQNQNSNLNQKLSERTINVIKLMPNDDKFVICLSDDSINICAVNGNQNHGLKIIKEFFPLKLREKYLTKSNKIEILEQFDGTENDYDIADESENVEKLIRAVTQDYRMGLISDIAFNQSGNEFLMSCWDCTITVFSASLWQVKKIIKFPNISIRQFEFLPTQEHQKPVMSLSSDNSLFIFDPNQVHSKVFISKFNSYKFAVSENGKILSNIVESGEIFVYNLDFHLALLRKSFSDVGLVNDYYKPKNGKSTSDARLSRIQVEVSGGNSLRHG